MTTQQIILWTCAYLIELAVVIYFTRATARRVVGALVGGAVAGCFGLGAIALCKARSTQRYRSAPLVCCGLGCVARVS